MKVFLLLICITVGVLGLPIAFAGSQSDTSPSEQICCLISGIGMVAIGVTALVLFKNSIQSRFLAIIALIQLVLLAVVIVWGM